MLYLIKQHDTKPPQWHANTPHYRAVVCCNKSVARWECGWTGDGFWMWSHTGEQGSGWLLERWCGLNVDYGHLVRGGELPDGSPMGFWHPHSNPLPWDLLRGAVWFSTKRVKPIWLWDYGIIKAPDEFTLRRIIESERYL